MDLNGNLVNWLEIPVNDIKRAKTFYEQVFEIELMDLDIGDGTKMALFPNSQDKVGGALIENKSFYHPGEQGPLLYLNGNPNLQQYLDHVKKAGGEIIIQKRMITEEYGHMAVIKDTEGNRIALHSNA
ncbi:MAG: VOC family protein [Cyclobacteriaceae bacterium]